MLNRSNITDMAIYNLAHEFFDDLESTEKDLKKFLSHEQQRVAFLRWVDNLVKDWTEDSFRQYVATMSRVINSRGK